MEKEKSERDDIFVTFFINSVNHIKYNIQICMNYINNHNVKTIPLSPSQALVISPVLVEHPADLLLQWIVKSLPTLPLAQAIK